MIESANYGEVSHFVTEFLTTHTYKLIEAAAEQTARAVLLHFPLIQKLKFSIHKPWAPVGLPLSDVAVEIERGWHKVYLAFGSNMGDRRKYIKDADDFSEVFLEEELVVFESFEPQNAFYVFGCPNGLENLINSIAKLTKSQMTLSKWYVDRGNHISNRKSLQQRISRLFKL